MYSGNGQNTQQYQYGYNMQQGQPIQQQKVPTKVCGAKQYNSKLGNPLPSCHLEKPITEFHTGKGICKECVSKYTREYNQRRKEEKKKIEEELQKAQETLQTLSIGVPTNGDEELHSSLLRMKSENQQLLQIIKERDDLLSRITAERDQLNQSNSDKNKQITQLQGLNRSLEAENSNLKRKLLEAESQIQSIENDKFKLREENKGLTNQVTSLRQQLSIRR